MQTNHKITKRTRGQVLECGQCELRRQSWIILLIRLIEYTEIFDMRLAWSFDSVVGCEQFIQTHNELRHHSISCKNVLCLQKNVLQALANVC